MWFCPHRLSGSRGRRSCPWHLRVKRGALHGDAVALWETGRGCGKRNDGGSGYWWQTLVGEEVCLTYRKSMEVAENIGQQWKTNGIPGGSSGVFETGLMIVTRRPPGGYQHRLFHVEHGALVC
ncbi:hypothetical protein SBA5_110050 [Candidatus Sulfotelmatomonas gaucii]|uniref:Uncharacterized protein n=1 Tax=Candidatus Sulfuritelmatomonas gaucii TaxID=2043161 RepID=A0A2N9L362_9BACT|nr:hypothetical protein SBA5_110050 [Candidatus Sulfotelmatomonas gaucii]